MLKKLWLSVKSVLEPVSKFMASVVNLVLLFVVYFIGIGIVSIISKLSGKHFLNLKIQNKTSDWHNHKVKKEPIEKYYRMF